MRQLRRNGFSLVELVTVIVVSLIVFVTTPPLLLHGVKALVFLPRALVVNQAAAEVLHQIVEGGFSDPTITGQAIVRGLRFAVRRSTTEPALWLVEATRVGFLTADGQYVVVRLDATPGAEVIRRRVLPAAATCSSALTGGEEPIPYDAVEHGVRILAPALMFRYYDQNGAEVTPGCPLPATTIRRVDIAFVAQTRNGVFDEGDPMEQVRSSVAIRVP